MPHIEVKAPAKLNLHLQVGDTRPDGFHELESLFIALAFGDTLCVETAPQPLSLEICMEGQFTELLTLPPEKNMVFRAVSLFRSRTGYDEGLKISLEKRIPPGGGLGGGSSDAAAALLALNRLAAPTGKGLVSEANLAEMGAALGSDVPFFLCNASAAWVSGKGEKIRPLVVSESAYGLTFVLVNPGFSSGTAEAYRLLDSVRKDHPQMSTIHGEFCSAFWSKPPHEWPFFNDFLPVLEAAAEIPAYSEAGTSYQHIIADLKGHGAEFAGLSGSGSTCFGAFSERSKAEIAVNLLLQQWPFVIFTFLLAR
ncbi:MAG: 4-(cytidine 5'-diphospho)-2-C-methyl-D-erythritol kinase [Treponema sp.]|jgi:4-diphosphocytidyl-2-C-methyl-D-erythritol kinase|nr:4-(cytidine 5'-diphospho)-2-C-methyl-D-erythritol kinase [Treponema sp.]